MKTNLKFWRISSFSRWYVIRARRKDIARKHGVAEFGRGMVVEVIEATDDDIKSYKYWSGKTEIEAID